MAPYAAKVAEWLREDPDLSGAEILRRVWLAGYRGAKSALYELVRRLRAPESRYRRCPRCRLMMRGITEICPRCGLGLPLRLPRPLVLGTGALAAPRQKAEALARRRAPRLPPIKQYLLVAAPDRRELYEYFKRKFGRAATIEVVRDRRVADRRPRAAELPLDRRRRHRQARLALDAELRTFGFAIVIRE